MIACNEDKMKNRNVKLRLKLESNSGEIHKRFDGRINDDDLTI